MRKPRSRGQLSAEALTVFLVFIVILGTVAAAISNVVSASDRKLARTLAQSAFSSLSGAIGDACFLGSGNVRTIPLPKGGFNVSASGKTLTVSSGDFSASYESKCDFLPAEKGFSGEIMVENSGGVIEIS
jgi:hypothetical protein